MKTSKIIFAAVAALSLLAAPALAYESECAVGDEKRAIRVKQNPAPDTLCEVVYAVNDGGESRLWWANVEKDYCEKRARELTAKFRELGYNCAEKND